jgi:molybdate transport system substrate-binding protein
MCTLRKRSLAVCASLLASSAVAQPHETVEIFSAGSLRGVVSDVAHAVSDAYGIELKPTFGGSGLLRERIEKGETPDLFLSADVASPRKLEAVGRAVVPTVAFARNRMCIVSRRALQLSASNLVERLLAKDVRLKTSTPIADPAGDYAWAILDRIDAQRPGSGAVLKAKAQASMNLTATPQAGQSAAAALFQTKQVDVSITYCSATAALEQEVPEITHLVVSGPLDPHPVDGMAVLSSRDAVLRVALYLLSDKGQAIIAHAGLVPISEGAAVSP